MTKGICHFCGLEKELINSHIMPKCFYKLDKYGPIRLYKPNSKESFIGKYQNGLTEPLLCAKCDTHIGKYDGYANKLFYKKLPELTPVIKDRRIFYLFDKKSFDYQELRLFFVSLVWRASISSERFSLGTKYEPIALKFLKQGFIENDNLFFPIIFRKNTGTGLDFMSSMYRRKLYGQKACVFRSPNYEFIIVTNLEKCTDNNAIAEIKTRCSEKYLIVEEQNTFDRYDFKLKNIILQCASLERWQKN